MLVRSDLTKIYLLTLLLFGLQVLASSQLEANPVKSELSIIKDDLMKKLLQVTINPRHFDDKGAMGANIKFEKGAPNVPRFDVSFQRNSLTAIARGVAQADRVFIELGLKGIDYGFDHQDTKNGTFGLSAYAETMSFVSHAVRAYFILHDSKLGDEYADRLQSYIPKLLLAGDWLAYHQNRERLSWEKRSAKHTNQIAWAGLCLALLGKLNGESRFQEEGEKYILKVLKSQWEDGVFPEHNKQSGRIGPDTNYQTVTLEALGLYLLYFPDSTLAPNVKESLKKGWAWEKSQITTEGEVLATNNVRTGDKGERDYFGKVKVVSYPAVCRSLIYWAHIGDDREARTSAEKVLEFGIALWNKNRRSRH